MYLHHLGITALNPMQEATQQAISTQQDIILRSPTGSGKTIAFLLPLIAKLDPQAAQVQALILVPSRELALQIEDVFRKMQTGLKVNACYGGHDIKVEINSLSHPPALLIGTPGRILDHLERRTLRLDHIHTVILDEYDKSLEFGFQEQMVQIFDHLPTHRQTILCSATAATPIPAFAGLKSPLLLDFVTPAPPLAGLTLRRAISPDPDKLEALLRLIAHIGDKTMLIFLNHREAVDRVSDFLAVKGLHTLPFHGGMDQEDRERTLAKLRNGSSKILVTTDLAARGLDIPEIEAVIHYHLPLSADAFTHRNGRTARMNAQGIAYVLHSQEEDIPGFIPSDLPLQDLPTKLNLPPQPQWTTLYFGRGKKDKINKVDIVGFLTQKGKLPKEDIGLIEVKDHHAYTAIKRSQVTTLLRTIRDQKLKGQKVKIERSR